MIVYVKSKEGKYCEFSPENGDLILLQLTDEDRKTLSQVNEEGNECTFIAFSPGSSEDESLEDIVSFILNGEGPSETISRLRGHFGIK